MANETNIKVLKLEVDTGTGEIKINGLKSNIQGLDKAVNNFGKTAKKAQAELKNFESSAGIAGATVNELGRLVSDLPFGITAITNNLSQLGSMFAILVTKVGGFQAAIASLWRTIMGPVGILLAFQGAVAALQFWEQSSKKAEKSQDDLSKAIGGAATELKEAVKILNDENISLERKEKLLKNINSEYEGMNLALNENNQLKETSLEQVNKEIDALIRLDKAKVLVGQLKEIREEIQILEDTPPEEVLGFWGKAKLWLMQDLLQDGLVSDEDINKAGEAAKDKILDGLQKKLAEKEGELTPELLETLFGKKGKEGGEDLTPKVQKLVFRVFGTLEEEMARYRKELQRKFGTDYLDVETLLKDSATNALKGLKPIEKAIEAWTPFDVWAYNTKSDLEEVAEGLDAIADVTEAITNVMSAEFKKQLDIEQNKTTLINNELRKRLAEEQLSADERKNIQ
jgi:predicted DNA-binding WGR domain protein